MQLDDTDSSVKLNGLEEGGHWEIPFENGKIQTKTDDSRWLIIGENEEGELVVSDYYQEYLDKIYGVIDEREECEHFPQHQMFTAMRRFE